MFDFSGIYSLIELFNRADVRILLWLNQFANSDSKLFKLCHTLTDEGSDVMVLLTLLLLWFWPSNQRAPTLFGEPALSLKGKDEHVPWWKPWLSTITREDEYQPVLTRQNSRAQVLLFATGGFAAYITARLIAFSLDAPRPFVTYWPVMAPQELPGFFGKLRTFGTFPSDHAAMLGALACTLFFWNRRLGYFWLVMGVLLAICRVAVGFHYPLDMLGGAVVGVACVLPLLWIYRRGGWLNKFANDMAGTFEISNAPYCYIMYFFVLLGGLEAAMHFQHVLNLMFAVRGDILNRLGP